MSATMPFPAALRALNSDARLLFITRFTRLFAYWVALGNSRFLSGKSGAQRSAKWTGSHTHACGRYCGVAVPDDTRGPAWSTANAAGRSHPDGAGRPGIRSH